MYTSVRNLEPRSHDVANYKDIFKCTHATCHHLGLPATSPTNTLLTTLFNPLNHADLIAKDVEEKLKEQIIVEKKSTVNLHTFLSDLLRGTYDNILVNLRDVGAKVETGLELRTSTAMPLEEDFFQQLQREKEQDDNWKNLEETAKREKDKENNKEEQEKDAEDVVMVPIEKDKETVIADARKKSARTYCFVTLILQRSPRLRQLTLLSSTLHTSFKAGRKSSIRNMVSVVAACTTVLARGWFSIAKVAVHIDQALVSPIRTQMQNLQWKRSRRHVEKRIFGCKPWCQLANA